MMLLTALLVVVLVLLAASPLLLAHRAGRRAQLNFIKMRRIRLRSH